MTEYHFSWGFHRFHAMRLMENGKSMVSYRDSIHSSGKKRIVFGLHCAFLHYININCSLGRIHGWKSLLHTFDQSPSDLRFFLMWGCINQNTLKTTLFGVCFFSTQFNLFSCCLPVVTVTVTVTVIIIIIINNNNSNGKNFCSGLFMGFCSQLGTLLEHSKPLLSTSASFLQPGYSKKAM